MSPSITRYATSGDESENEVLQNVLGITTIEEINEAEYDGFVSAQQTAIEELSDDTVFDTAFLCRLHKNALGHIYSFAGNLRTVNMSKNGFAFPSAAFLPQAIQALDTDFLQPLAATDGDTPVFLSLLARMHAEALYIHPFREGNGRVIRLFTTLLYLAKTGRELDLSVLDMHIDTYIQGVQQASSQQYTIMEELFTQMARP